MSNYYSYGLGQQKYMLGKSAGIFMNGFLKRQFNPGIDVQYSEVKDQTNGDRIYMNDFPYFSSSDTFHYSDISQNKSILDLKLDLEFTSPQEDTLVIGFSLQPGLAFLKDHTDFSNSNLPDLYNTAWVASLGGSGTIRKNYLFGSPLQIFLSLSAQGYLIEKPGEVINIPFYGNRPLIIGYVKLGLAYKL